MKQTPYLCFPYIWLALNFFRKHCPVVSEIMTLQTNTQQHISIVKPSRCINVSNLFFWSNTLHVWDGLSVHHQELKTVNTATGICQTDTADCLLAFPLASSRQYLFDICLLQYVKSLTLDDGRKDRPKHVECYSNKINLRHWWIWLVLLWKYTTMHGPMKAKAITQLELNVPCDSLRSTRALLKHIWQFMPLMEVTFLSFGHLEWNCDWSLM